MNKKKHTRLRRALKVRSKIKKIRQARLTVHRTPKHIYAQLISPNGDVVVTGASSLDKEIRASGYTGNVNAAEKVGELIAKRAIEAGFESVAFDRSGFMYHGRIKALADAARRSGLKF